MGSKVSWQVMDGSEAVARIAYQTSEFMAIYPITPSSVMAELADAWRASGKPNLWGEVPRLVEMQSEGGAAGAIHGAATKGSLVSTFTASQGLLLMLPNMYKIAGELTPAVIHVAARTVATHALSIFGDHSDVMSARMTGWAMLHATSVQEAHDFALIAHAATLRSRVPFMHIMDGFRTSHEENKIQVLGQAEIRALIREADVVAQHRRGLTPEAPVLRGTAQNPDVFFQAREAANPYYDAVAPIVQGCFDEMVELTGREYHLVDYYGSPDAERVVVVLGSAFQTVKETVDELNRSGQRVGVATLRLYRPFPASELLAALPATVRAIAVLDRTKEPGASGEPLLTDVGMALLDDRGHFAGGVPVLIGGRYGLSSKEFTPGMAAAVFAELAVAAPKRRFSVGITDDVTNLSLPIPDEFNPAHQLACANVTGDQHAVFIGLGSDGSVSAAKNNVKIIGAVDGHFAQGFFVYDSRKAGATTVSHLRFSDHPIEAPYLVNCADFVAVHHFQLLETMPTLDRARQGATVLLNSPYPNDQVWEHLPVEIQQLIIERQLIVWTINANRISAQAGLGGRVNTVMQTCFFRLSGVLEVDAAIAAIKEHVAVTYAEHGASVIERNYQAIDAALSGLERLAPGALGAGEVHRMRPLPEVAPEFVQQVTAAILHGRGDELPVSAFPVDGTWPTATSQWEKRAINTEMPIWDPTLCIDCGKCAIACPHAAIRLKVAPDAVLESAPEFVLSKPYRDRSLPGHRLIVQVAPDDCTGCGVCVDVCPARSKTEAGHKAIDMADAVEHRGIERARYDFFKALPEVDRSLVRHDQAKGVALLEPLFEFSLACAGCGETPYLRTLTQLFGDRMVVANATGCSSIFGGNLPTTPWAVDACGRGPAWSNSLFEDDAEFGLGMRLAYEQQRDAARRLLGAVDGLDADLVAGLVDADQSDEAGVLVQRGRVGALKETLAGRDDAVSVRLLELADSLVEQSVWIIGGDGWAYDIGFGGLDHVLASGANVNILVLDTQVYSNTGGQASKATPRGAGAKFSSAGKPNRAKDLGLIAQTYDGVYVAQVAIGANQQQTIRALAEAQAWSGPSLVIAYSTCIAHGIDMATSMTHQEDLIASGMWPLYRFRPGEGLHLDSRAPQGSVAEFMASETRFSVFAASDPDRAEHFTAQSQADADRRWQLYRALAEMETQFSSKEAPEVE